MIPPFVGKMLEQAGREVIKQAPKLIMIWKNRVVPQEKWRLQQEMEEKKKRQQQDKQQTVQSTSGKKVGGDSGNEEV